MTLGQFEAWLHKLDPKDLAFLERNAAWKKERNLTLQTRVLPKGFVEKTMELLEGGSESET